MPDITPAEQAVRQRTNRWKRASVLRGPVFAATPTTPIPPAGQEGGA